MKREAFRALLRTFVERAELVAGLRRGSAPSTSPEVAELFDHIPIDPEALLVLSYWVRSRDDAAAGAGAVAPHVARDWFACHGRLLVRRRIEVLAADLGIEPPAVAAPRRRLELDSHQPSSLWIRTRLAFGLGPRSAIVTCVIASRNRWVGFAEIGHDACLPERTIREAAGDLAAAGFIRGLDRGGLIPSLADPVEALARPRSRHNHRPWRRLLELIVAADRELALADEDPLGLDDRLGPRGPIKRFRTAAADAGFRSIARSLDPMAMIDDPDPSRGILDAMTPLLGSLDGW